MKAFLKTLFGDAANVAAVAGVVAVAGLAVLAGRSGMATLAMPLAAMAAVGWLARR